MKSKAYRLLDLKTIVTLLSLMITGIVMGQSNEDCLMCHEDPELSMVRNGKNVSLFISRDALKNSVHSEEACAKCHIEQDAENFPHSEGVNKMPVVSCGSCHNAAEMQYFQGIHGQAFSRNEPYAPTCKECHGTHKVLDPANPESKTYKMNIPYLCGNCHKEGAPVARIYNITEHNIMQNYSQGIHGKGLFESGLLVTATCNDCHDNHMTLPSTDKRSTVHHDRVAGTCMKCHVRIEQTHKKIIRNELWEEKPGAVPSCSDCHPPHIVQISKIEETISNKQCLSCHDKSNVEKRPLYKGDTIKAVDYSHLGNSVHVNIPCVKCHADVNSRLDRPCETAQWVDCSNCHIEVANEYFQSGHGKSYLAKIEDAPYCTDCHGSHETKSKNDDKSQTYRAAIPNLCGRCHRKDGQANKNTDLKEVDAFADYSSSIHGKGLLEKGLIVSAICIDCHTTHREMKESDTLSSINRKNVSQTCAKCHKSIYDEYLRSDHSIRNDSEDLKYPTCTNCHSSHVISEIDENKFMYEITVQCGNCHKKLSETYKDTYHGKAYMLGDMRAARCSDCHGSHNIYKVDNSYSQLSFKNIVNTCKKCHANANLEFTGYLTHATHNDNKVLFYSFWGMTILLVSVFAFFGIHTLLWLPKSLKQRRQAVRHEMPTGKTKYVRRFNPRQRFTHLMVILSFLTLALTGMTLKFAHMEWAAFIANLLGGVKVAGNLHRFAAIITFGYFAFHLNNLLMLKKRDGISLKDFIFGKNSLMFNMQDLTDLRNSIKWFLGKGPRPEYGRWTYWEKFDYMAVFWGVAVIGFSGLVLWFPEFFTLFLPGWAINVAQIIHSDEALLAAGFIFTIHFFNTHLRPESFPMDIVIFTGHVPFEEFKKDRPREYNDLVESGKLDKVVVEKEFAPSRIRIVKFFGYTFLTLGVIMIILILYSLLMGVY